MILRRGHRRVGEIHEDDDDAYGAAQRSAGGGRATHRTEWRAERILRSGNDQPVVETRPVLRLQDNPAAGDAG